MKYLRKFDSVSDMETAIASSEIDIIGLAYNGSTPVLRIKTGGTPEPDPTIPFYIDVRGAVTLAATSGLQMSTDGETWTDTTAATLSSGKTYFRVASDKLTPLKPNLTENSSSDYDVGGNINSLVKVNFENDTTCYKFYASSKGFFQDKKKLKSAGNLILPATILVASCYMSMFQGCTGLTTAPTLPATTLAQSCYYWMFMGCTSLTTAPALPATTLANYCYGSMFYNCTSLATAPELPATRLANGCYNSMFLGCIGLTTAPALPATTLVESCYNAMFQGCTTLTTAPELPAEILAQSCYSYIFQGCTNLSYIKCLATNISATDCTKQWVKGVASTGTFVKNSSMKSWTTGANSIPSNWTVQDAQD